MTKRFTALLIFAILALPSAARPLSDSPPLEVSTTTSKSASFSAAAALKPSAGMSDDSRVGAIRKLLASRSEVENGIEPQAGTCSTTETACNRNETGSLSPSDCTLDDDNTSVDLWTFQGTEGQQVTITLRSTDFDAYLFLMNPVSEVVANDDDSAGGSDAQITYTLTQSGVWTIAVNSYEPGYGSYTLSVSCSSGGPSCSIATMSCGQTISGSLNSSDCALDDGTYVEFWDFSGSAGQRIVATMRSASLNSYLGLLDPNGEVVAEDDNGAGGNDARIDFTLTQSGTWAIAANSYSPASGSFTLEL
ncbi:MAG: PPC domain-containing protein, partial [Acidobacteria bacterium]|nr:PPC domain-containing protein [Acidobacteriota bacterium]